MTSPRRLEQEMPALLADLYLAGLPDYRDDLLRSTAATRQRPVWSFPTRWLPMDLTMRRVPVVPAVGRVIALAVLIAALIATALFVGAQQRRVPPPFGPARNGSIVASRNGDLFVRDAATGESRLVLGGPEADSEPGFSPDGLLMAFVRTGTDDRPYLTVADLDGTHVRRVLETPLDGQSWAQWAPDSRHLGVVMLIDGRNRFALASTDGKPLQVADMGDLVPYEFQFRPPDGREIVVRAADHGQADLYVMNADGSSIRKLNRHSNGAFGFDMDLGGSSWSPTGDRLAYNVVDRDPVYGGDHLRVHVLNLATMADVELPAPRLPDLQQAWPSWSPDGSQILFQRFTWEKGWLALVPADGSSPGRDLGTAVTYDDDSHMDQGWSPDGSAILLRFDDDHFVSIDVATGVETPLTWPVDKIPDWQRLAP
jgi:Tol biopolymer transport system component